MEERIGAPPPAGGAAGQRRSVTARAPGRVNLIGDHTDYNSGLALPMAIDLATEVRLVEDGSDRLRLRSAMDPAPAVRPAGRPDPASSEAWASDARWASEVTGAPAVAELPLDLPFDPVAIAAVEPPWARLAAAVVAQCRPPAGGHVEVSSTVPVGAGLASSAAFGVALAMACGVQAPPVAMAHLCQRAEAAAGSDVGLMDPLVIAGALAGHALLVDFATLAVAPVALPPGAEVVVVHSGRGRRLVTSPYAARRAECAAAAVAVGRPLGQAEEADLPGLPDRVLRSRTRHVVTECRRVQAFADALRAGDLVTAGALMVESHRSLADDFEASAPAVDALVDELQATDGVYGARMTGGGFGGCVVALAEPGALDPAAWPGRAWQVRPSGGATVAVTPPG